ncbi:MAG: DNA-binding protein WhiA [Firmicutes bacterium]|nr:DNA-binding protein WhiA [Bacillota bacterium]
MAKGNANNVPTRYDSSCLARGEGGGGRFPHTFMGFSRATREELARIMPERRCCQLAELAGLAYVDGTMTAQGYDVAVGQAAAARTVYLLFKQLFQPYMEIKVRHRARFARHNIYIVRIPHQPQLEKIYGSLVGVQHRYGEGRWGRACCRRSFLRGIYLGRGSLTNPRKHYHLEIVTDSFQQAAVVQSCMETFGLTPGVVQRKKHVALYLKDGEQISQFLNLLGGHTALLRLESVRVVKGMRNQVNRLVNCETANMDKTLEAALHQIENIRLIDATEGLESLSPDLQEVAGLRLQYPYASLKELGQYLDPPLSKSGVNHRFRKIRQIAEELRGEVAK